MTTTLIHHCDRCGRTITADRTLLEVASGPLRDRTPRVDLCRPCAERLRGWLLLATPELEPFHAPAL